MKTTLTSTCGKMPKVEINWADIYAANEMYNTVIGALRADKNSDTPQVWIEMDKSSLKKIATILFHMVHAQSVDELNNLIYTPIVENSDFNIDRFI